VPQNKRRATRHGGFWGATQERGRFGRDPAAALRSTRHWLATKATSLAAAQIVLTGPKKKPGIARL